jgi:hypothetical protein
MSKRAAASAQRPSIGEVLARSQWKHALFTTYALSLSYFESEVLRPLLQGGCDDIWLITDAEGYRASLLERHSSRIGHEYRLVPAALPNGVFHAKCTYLSGDEGDLLLIGSGNVTFGGHGKNAEVFEVLSPGQSATAFADFAEFLTALRERTDIQIGQRDWIDDFTERAANAADRGSDLEGEAPVRLLHSLRIPFANQIATELSAYGKCTRAIVMSPYHDTDGGAVRTLAENLELARIEVAVTNEEASPFPFKVAGKWGTKAIPIRPKLADRRFVHAKWYEFETVAHRIILTGSVNATRKALTTTENVEAAVLRTTALGRKVIRWEKAEAPPYVAPPLLPSGLGNHEIVYASFDRTEPGVLHGKLVSLQDCEGSWDGRISQADGQHVSFVAWINSAGHFRCYSSGLERFAELPALQITLQKGKREARGWVHNDMYLSMSRRRRLTEGALSRLMRREATDDDLEALLEYLAVSAHNHIRTFSLGFTSPKSEGDASSADSDTVRVSIEDIAPVESLAEPGGASHRAAAIPLDNFEIAMSRLRRMLLGHGKERSQAASADRSHAVMGEDADESGRESERLPENAIHRLGLERFESEMVRILGGLRDQPAPTRSLLSMLLEVGLWMRLFRLNDRDLAYAFLQSWLFRATQQALVDEKIGALEQHVVTAVAVIHVISGELHESPAVQISLHDALERFYGGKVDPERARKALVADRHVGVAQLIPAEDAGADLEAAITPVLAHPTRRQQLLDALALAEVGQQIPTGWTVFSGELGQALFAAFHSPQWQKRIRRAPPRYEACAFDYFSFSKQARIAFRAERMGRCIHCNRFTLRLDP